ncbi:MCP four helix bundle domain-containing protein, partial [Bacillus atrophaeus]|uniref:MCP four helix bundle domain-containing protein n=1 Tax=Bacillus atrophaeus TaxID=1452 RepID=UPI001EFBC476
RLAEVNAASAEIRDRWLQSTRLLGDLNNVTSDYRAAEASHLLAAGQADMAASERELGELERAVVQAERSYEQLPPDATESRMWHIFIVD